MSGPLYFDVQRRNPFRVRDLPPIARLYRAAFRKRRRVAKRFVGKPAKRWFDLAYHGLKLGGDGRFSLVLPDGERDLQFNARNTQFGALYLPQNAAGYEPEVAALLDVLLPDDGVFYDVGANWGYFPLYAASRPGFRGRVEAFEPMPGTFADLEALVEQAGLGGTVRCHRLAASDREGTAVMGLDDGLHSGTARLGGTAGGSREVPLARLDRLDLSPPSLIKMDVEGHEADALAGAEALLSAHRPAVVFESWREWHDPETTLRPFAVLAAQGYVFYQAGWSHDIDGLTYATERPATADGRERLMLVPMVPEQRFLLADQLNVVALPAP